MHLLVRRRRANRSNCDDRQRLSVRPVTAGDGEWRHMAAIVVLKEARMWRYKFNRFATAALVVAIVLAFAVPFVLRLISPLVGR